MSAVTLSSRIQMVKINSAHLRVTFLDVSLKSYIFALFIIGYYYAITKLATLEDQKAFRNAVLVFKRWLETERET